MHRTEATGLKLSPAHHWLHGGSSGSWRQEKQKSPAGPSQPIACNAAAAGRCCTGQGHGGGCKPPWWVAPGLWAC